MVETRTGKGIWLLHRSMMGEFIVTLFSQLTLFALLYLSIDSDGEETGLGGINLGILCLIGIILLTISAIFVTAQIMGIVKLYRGRYEFGCRHRKNMLVGLTLYGIGWLIVSFALFVPWVFSLAGVMVIHLSYVFFIVSVAKTKQRRMLWIGFAMRVASPILLIVGWIFILWTWTVSLGSELEAQPVVMVGVTVTALALGLAGFVVTVMAYGGTCKAIRDGSIEPSFEEPGGTPYGHHAHYQAHYYPPSVRKDPAIPHPKRGLRTEATDVSGPAADGVNDEADDVAPLEVEPMAEGELTPNIEPHEKVGPETETKGKPPRKEEPVEFELAENDEE